MAKTTNKKNEYTLREQYAYLLTLCAGDKRAEDFIAGRVAQLDKKNATDGKPTAQQIANDKLREQIVAVMSAEPNRLFAPAELAKALNSDEPVSVPKVSSLVRTLVDSQTVEKSTVKGKVFYQYKG